MYKCDNCGAEFDYPDITRDFVSEYFGQPVTHMKTVCPVCGRDDFEEMDTCDICGEHIPSGEGICDNCHELVEDFASEIRGKLREKSIIHKLDYGELLEYLMDELEE